MLRVYILQHYGAFYQHIPSYAFIVERQLMKLEDKTLPNVNILKELGDITKTKSVKLIPNTLYN